MREGKQQLIRIISAVPLSDDAGRRMAGHFAHKLGFEHYDVQVEYDPALIGGVIVYAGDYRYDHSIKGQLSRIAGHLRKQQTYPFDEQEKNKPDTPLSQESLDDVLASFPEPPIISDIMSTMQNQDSEKLNVADDTEKDQQQQPSKQMDAFIAQSAVDEVGVVLKVNDGVAFVRGIENCLNNELIILGDRALGIAMNLENDQVGVIMLQSDDAVRQGTICKRTGAAVRIPAGPGMLGRVVDALGQPIDGMGLISDTTMHLIESPAPSIIDRKPVSRPLPTGITAIDALTPIGHGQRELIIGDRQTGKTALALDAIINQRGRSVYCIYVAIGQKMSTIASVVNTLQKHDALAYTTIVVASASDSAAMQYLAPYTGCALAEGLLEQEQANVLVIYDDLTKHAQAYRAISLLLRRPPGREAFPGDIFYLHARLLERACQLNDEKGGGSITALPIVETQSGDISAYIPTNVISITDGQIYLESDLFYSGQRPAVNVGLSVSRVGGAAQTKAMKSVAGPLRIKLAQYRELEAFAQFGSELDKVTQEQLKTGIALLEVLKQQQYNPQPVENQVIMLFLANRGVLTDLDREDIRPFLVQFLQFLQNRHPIMMSDLAQGGVFSLESIEMVEQAFKTYWPRWQTEQEEYAATV